MDRSVAFLVWMVVGFLGAFGIASLPSIGLFVLAAGLVALVLGAYFTRGRGIGGFLVGAGLVGLLLAYLHRQGPLAPMPFLVGGVVAIMLGFVVELGLRRRALRV